MTASRGNATHYLILFIVAICLPALLFLKVRDPILLGGYILCLLGILLSRRYAVLTYATIILCTFTAALALIDLYVSFFADRSTQAFSGSYAGSYFQRYPEIGYNARPSRQYQSVRYDKVSGKVIYDATYTISELGFRKTLGAENGEKIVFLGDSAMFGEGLNDNQALPQIFSDLTDRKFHVMNFGFHGYGPQQALRMLETGLFDSQIGNSPKLFVLQVHPWLVQRTACIPDYTYRGPKYAIGPDGAVRYAGSCRSDAFYYLDYALKQSPGLGFIWSSINLRPLRKDDFDLFLKVVSKIDEIAKNKYHSRLLIVYLKYDDGLFASSGYSNEKILDYFRNSGLSFIEATLREYLRSDGKNDGLTIPDDGHPTETANARRAHLVVDWFREYSSGRN
ncbi:MAG: hypothetical protein AB7K04_00465 [Pseudorhodoplanes sp.]